MDVVNPQLQHLIVAIELCIESIIYYCWQLWNIGKKWLKNYNFFGFLIVSRHTAGYQKKQTLIKFDILHDVPLT